MSSEHEHLLGYLNGYAKDINTRSQLMNKKYHAIIDKSGAIPQLIISEK